MLSKQVKQFIILRMLIAVILHDYLKETNDENKMKKQKNIMLAFSILSSLMIFPGMLMRGDQDYDKGWALIQIAVIATISWLGFIGKIDYLILPRVLFATALVDFLVLYIIGDVEM